MTASNSPATFMGMDAGMKAPFIISIGLHVGLFIVSLVGLPFLVKDIPQYTAIPITIEVIDTKTQTPEPVTPQNTPPPQAKMDSETPPDLITPKPKEEPKPEPEEPKEEPKKEQPKPEPVPDPDKKPEPPKKEEKKPEPKKEDVTKVEKTDPKKDFSSILKNLTPDAEEKKDDKPADNAIESDKKGVDAPIGERLSMSEMDAIQSHIYPCWNVPSGAKFAEDLIVTIRMSMNRDGTVQNAIIVNNPAMAANPAYRAASESALRAVRNPRCSPLPLPMDKYNHWKTITLNFDRRGML